MKLTRTEEKAIDAWAVTNLDKAAEEYSERFQDEKYKLYAFHGFRDGAMWRGSQAQRLSNDIDRAAELSANDAMIKRQFPSVVYNTGLKCFDHSDLIKQFIAGAEWQKEQMTKEAVFVQVVGEQRDLRLIDSTQRCLFNAKRGDWLKIIIVKEESK